MPTTDRASVAVLPFSLEDDSAVTWAVHHFETDSRLELRVMHPDRHGVDFPELSELRLRFASHLAGRYHVWAGHPDAGSTREDRPTLHFVRATPSR